MPNTRRSSVLQPVTPNLPPTPGRQVKALKGELDEKSKENEALKIQIAELSKALGGIQIVKEKVSQTNAFNYKTETKKGKKAKNPDAPVPAKTAYKYYCEANPSDGKSTGDAMRQKWKECQGEERNKFVALAEVDKKRFKEENAVYLEKVAKAEAEEKALESYYEKQKQDLAVEFVEAHLQAQKALEEGKGKKKTQKDPEAPKRAMSSYFYFVKENRAKFVRKYPSASIIELSKILGEEWGKLDKGKGGKKGTKKYDTMAENDKARYLEEKTVYEASKTERELKLQEEREQKLAEDKEEAMKMQKEEEEKIQMLLSNAASENQADDVMEDASVAGPTEKKTKKEKKAGPKKASTSYNYFMAQNRQSIKACMPENCTNAELLTEIGRQWKILNEEQKKPYDALAAKDKVRYQKELEIFAAAQSQVQSA